MKKDPPFASTRWRSTHHLTQFHPLRILEDATTESLLERRKMSEDCRAFFSNTNFQPSAFEGCPYSGFILFRETYTIKGYQEVLKQVCDYTKRELRFGNGFDMACHLHQKRVLPMEYAVIGKLISGNFAVHNKATRGPRADFTLTDRTALLATCYILLIEER